ncbi:hypothetical protein [Microbulbifer yueqingensis]|uniref:hypothetical protein n=1 Tax=Microbulbifer yueqingensis TaxID=658219 RepID=UPI001FE228B5|nr:hypothetical protein [Microbulbifer yueqingensis]
MSITLMDFQQHRTPNKHKAFTARAIELSAGTGKILYMYPDLLPSDDQSPYNSYLPEHHAVLPLRITLCTASILVRAGRSHWTVL